MKIEERLDSIKHKLDFLKHLDKEPDVAARHGHKYVINPCVSEAEVRVFEKEHNIDLPNEYRLFLLKVCNGNVGPGYGLHSLAEVKSQLFLPHRLCFPFPHTGYYNPPYNELKDEFGEGYVENEFDGQFDICSYGCGISVVIVVSGAEKGNLWCMDMGNENGLYPLTINTTPGQYSRQTYKPTEDRIGFLDWYEHWLDTKIEKLSHVT